MLGWNIILLLLSPYFQLPRGPSHLFNILCLYTVLFRLRQQRGSLSLK